MKLTERRAELGLSNPGPTVAGHPVHEAVVKFVEQLASDLEDSRKQVAGLRGQVVKEAVKAIDDEVKKESWQSNGRLLIAHRKVKDAINALRDGSPDPAAAFEPAKCPKCGEVITEDLPVEHVCATLQKNPTGV